MLAQLLVYLRTSLEQDFIGIMFGNTPSCVSRDITETALALYDVLSELPDAQFRFPTPEEMTAYANMIEQRYY